MAQSVVCNPWNIENEIVLRHIDKNETLFQRQAPIMEFVRPILSKCQFSLNDIEKWEPYPSSPWLFWLPEFYETLKWKKSEGPLEAGAETNLYIDNDLSEYLQIYTDGSVNQNSTDDQNFGSTGFGIYVKPQDNNIPKEKIRIKCSPFLSTFSVEMAAIVSALLLIIDKYPTVQFPKVAILTDSLSCIQALKARPKHRFQLQNKAAVLIDRILRRGQIVELFHVPSHCGVTGNEIADRVAKNATKLNRTLYMPYTRKEAYALIMMQCKKDKTLFPTYQLFPTPNGTYPNLPTENIILIRRLRVKISPCNYTIFNCKCNKRIKYEHLFEGCIGFKNETKDLLLYMKDKELTPTTILNKHTCFSWEPARLLCETIMKTSYSYCF